RRPTRWILPSSSISTIAAGSLIARRLSSTRWQTGALRQSLGLQFPANFVIGAVGDIAESLHEPEGKQDVCVHTHGHRWIAPLDLDHRDVRREGPLCQQVDGN